MAACFALPLHLLLPSASHHRLAARRRRALDCPSASPHSCSPSTSGGGGDWSFEQRMRESLAVLDLMDTQAIAPDPSLFCSLLKNCADARSLRFGRLLHQRVLHAGLHADPFVANNLILLYSQCGFLGTARQLFDEMPVKNVVTWTTVISMYHHAGLPRDALDLYLAMRKDLGVKPNAFTYTIVLNSCASVRDLEMGVSVHEEIVRDGCDQDRFIIVALIDMYSKCGRVDAAHELFDRVAGSPSIEACTAMIEGYSANGEAREAMELVQRTLQSSTDPKLASKLGFTTLIRPCVMIMAFRQGQEIHSHIIKSGHRPSAKSLGALVELYEKCDKMTSAYRVFREIEVKDVSLWSRMVSGFVKNGLHREAFSAFMDMACSDARLISCAVSSAIQACVELMSLEEGKQIHGRVIKVPQLLEDSVVRDLAELYTTCGEHGEASKLKTYEHLLVDMQIL